MRNQFMGTWAKTNRVHAANDPSPAMIAVTLTLLALTLLVLAFTKITIAHQEQRILIERGVLQTGPYWK